MSNSSSRERSRLISCTLGLGQSTGGPRRYYVANLRELRNPSTETERRVNPLRQFGTTGFGHFDRSLSSPVRTEH
jgi:hypothetical protein